MKKNFLRNKVMILAVIACMTVGTLPITTFGADTIVVEEGGSSTSTSTTQLKNKVKSIVNKQVKTTDSKKTKLKKLFTYAEKTYSYKRATGFKNTKGWTASYALSMYNQKKGSCYHDAAAYAYLAKKATGYSVRVAIGKTNGFSGKWQNHAWTEVKIGSTWYICDVNMDRYAAKSSKKYYLKGKNTAAMKKVYKATSYVTIAL